MPRLNPQPNRCHSTVWAKRIADRLDLARAKGEWDPLILIAAREFPGALRRQLSASMAQLIGKNLVQKGEAEIRQYLFE